MRGDTASLSVEVKRARIVGPTATIWETAVSAMKYSTTARPATTSR
jgi:hypothetical protein